MTDLTSSKSLKGSSPDNFNDDDFDDFDLDDSKSDLTAKTIAETVAMASDQNDPGVMFVNGKKYAVNLFWLVAEEEGQDSLASRRAKKAHADFYCVRSSIITQHGFGKLSQGHRMGMSSAAAFAADMLVGEWHSVFKADNGWWYLAIHGDAIAPDGDRFFFDEEEAFNFFNEEMKKYKWPRSYAPKEWEIPNVTGELILEKMLDQASPTNLKPVTLDAIFAGRRNKMIAAGATSIVILLVFLVSLLPSLILSRIPEPPPLLGGAQLTLGQIKAPPKASQIERAIVGKMTISLPKPSSVVAACGEAISKIVRPLPGWTISDVSCDTKQVRVAWTQGKGTVELLLKNTGIFPEGATARLEGNQFVSTLRVQDTSNTEREVQPLDRVNSVLTLNRRLAGAGSLNVKFIQPPAPVQQQGLREQEVVQAPPPHLEVAFKTKTAPQSIASYLDIDGLEVKNIVWAFKSGEWSYDIKVNLKPNQ